ncbi:hypothetical protein D3C73_902410 [compost metagenome]
MDLLQKAHLAQLLENPRAVADARHDHHHAAVRRQRRDPESGFLKQRPIARQRNELLRTRGP